MDLSAPADVGSDHLGIGQRLVRQAARQFLAVVRPDKMAAIAATILIFDRDAQMTATIRLSSGLTRMIVGTSNNTLLLLS
jgi:hypothetical protein